MIFARDIKRQHVRAANDHVIKFRNRLVASFSEIVNFADLSYFTARTFALLHWGGRRQFLKPPASPKDFWFLTVWPMTIEK